MSTTEKPAATASVKLNWQRHAHLVLQEHAYNLCSQKIMYTLLESFYPIKLNDVVEQKSAYEHIIAAGVPVEAESTYMQFILPVWKGDEEA